MAVAGIQNVSVLDSSFLRESQTQSPRQMGEEGGRVTTRASSLLRMWRELEDEHVVSNAQERVRERLFRQRGSSFSPALSRTDSSESHGSQHSGESEDASVSENDHDRDDSGSETSDHSSDVGEVERGRVRQVSREWMSSGSVECAPSVPHTNNSPRAEWLGETEQERVRAMREWAQTSSQRRGTCSGDRENQPAELGGQSERIRGGSVGNDPNENQNQHGRRGIRRLCGRQALLDMVKKAEMERKTELQGLLVHKAVTNFPHRNRIQSLLRGWFLRNGRSTESGRPSSIAESELGLLRQKHTVSGLRGGFISRLDTAVCDRPSSSLSNSSNDDTNMNTNEQVQENNLEEIINDVCELSESNHGQSDGQECEIRGTSNAHDEFVGSSRHADSEESSASSVVEEWQERVPETGHLREWQWSTSPEFDERGEGTEQFVDVGSPEGTASERTLENDGESRNLEESGDEARDQSEPSREANDFPGLSGSGDALDTHSGDDTNRQESVSEVQLWQDQSLESEEREWEQDVAEYSEWRDDIGDSTDEIRQQSTELGWPVDDSRMEADEGGFQEAVQGWLEEPTDQEVVPATARQADTYYFPDDDNVHSVEIRELLSRRRVSNLLHSGFSESLNQLIQSYVERQGNAAADWEEHNSSPPPESVEQAVANPTEARGVVRPPVSLPLPAMPSPPTWDRESHHHDNWAHHDLHPRLGIEWEIINDMRIDMARLQQRMNNLQRMLETCMDMQLELQRSIRQEVSAALNRSSGSQGLSEGGFSTDDSKWDQVKKGVCCVCCDSNIDSLLYRCGHMCTCSNCANVLVESRGKCPMCRAPVVEVVRAYSIQ